MSLRPALQLKSVSRSYGSGENRLDIFKALSLEIVPGEIVGLIGPSGAGKSSLLHIAGLLEMPTSGEVTIAGQDCTHMDDVSRTAVRRIGIGFVYQVHHVLPEFSAVENVVIPQLIAGADKASAVARAKELLGRMKLSHRYEHRPAELSGGEQQRVAIARAIANRPLLLLADEPTGNLDPPTGEMVHQEFVRLIKEEGLAALIATHNVDFASRMTRVVRLNNGTLVDD